MLCYHNVYVPLLLILSNDVEENPGPTLYDIVDASKTVSANFSQGSERFGQNSGKQCVAMSLTSTVYNQVQDVNTWNSFSLDTILLNGNSLYSCISNLVNKDLLLLIDVPELVSIYDEIYNLDYSDPLAGDVFMGCSDEPFYSLEDALNKIFLCSRLNYNYALLTIGCNTVAIFKISERTYKIFDSHSRDLHGMPHSSGKCVLLTFEGIQKIVMFFQIASPEGIVPFEIKGVQICLNVSTTLQEMCVIDKNSTNQQQQYAVSSKCQNKPITNITDCTSEYRETFLSSKLNAMQSQANKTAESKEKRLLRQQECNKKTP